MAISTYGVKLAYGESSSQNTIDIKSFPSIMGKRSALETTTLSNDAQTFIPGIMQQEESFDFTANYDADTYDKINKLEGIQQCSLTFPDNSKYTWEGYISASVNEGDVDAVIEMTVSISPSSVPRWTKGTAT